LRKCQYTRKIEKEEEKNIKIFMRPDLGKIFFILGFCKELSLKKHPCEN